MVFAQDAGAVGRDLLERDSLEASRRIVCACELLRRSGCWGGLRLGCEHSRFGDLLIWGDGLIETTESIHVYACEVVAEDERVSGLLRPG